VGSAVGSLTDFPALFAQTYTALFGAGVTPPQNSLSIYDASGNLLPFGVRRYDGTTCFIDWQDDFAGVAKTVYLYWHPTVDPGSSFANPTGVYDADTDGVWHFEEASGNALDSTANGNTLGIVNGGPIRGVSGVGGSTAVTFPGAGGVGYLRTLGNALSLSVTSNFTISFWAKGWSDVVSYQPVATKGWTLYYIPAYKPSRFAWLESGSWVGHVVGASWKHIAVTYDGTNMKYWSNGAPISSGACSPQLGGDSYPFQVGYRVVPGYLYGSMDELVVSATVARSSTWINAEYLFGLGTPITVGAPEEIAAGGGLPLLGNRLGRMGPSLAGTR
jgi:hypothetical protein